MHGFETSLVYKEGTRLCGVLLFKKQRKAKNYPIQSYFASSHAALRPIVLRYAGAPISTRTCFFPFFSLFIWRCRFLRVLFVPLLLPLCMESTSYVLSFRMVFFYLALSPRAGILTSQVLCENSINESINQLIFNEAPFILNAI